MRLIPNSQYSRHREGWGLFYERQWPGATVLRVRVNIIKSDLNEDLYHRSWMHW
jgi:hypothetical protein